ncbi:hypothetical protein PF010_g837 [Phytophthora fragariae]|uniref:Uncharacterized protein n=1 Tax=Phytophthora fragariae TaxID=53985 RepID=A0A6G0M1T0_9STRA|nr:hypothetical protein PF010_g837 [Phytophthora fragariae]KAE9253108.1 hypothetical protein PF004_g1636 [Phytophthora fragariae]
MPSHNSRAQTLVRLISLWELHLGLRVSASHVRRIDNSAADSGSRRWESPHYANLFEHLTRGWTHAAPLPTVAALDNIWHDISASTLLPSAPTRDTPAPSRSGAHGLPSEGSIGGFAALVPTPRN